MTLIWRGVCGVGKNCAGDLHILSHLVIPVAYWERSHHPQVKDKETEVQQNLHDFQGGICGARKENLFPAPGSHASPTSLTPPLLGCLHLSAHSVGHPCTCAQSLSVQFSRSVVSNSLRPHQSQHSRPPCPSPTPGVHSDSRPSSWWCHPAISSSVVPSPPALNPSQHQRLFQWVNSSHEVAKVLEFQL